MSSLVILSIHGALAPGPPVEIKTHADKGDRTAITWPLLLHMSNPPWIISNP